MNPQQWLHEFESTLNGSGLPSKYIQRIVGELNDHHEDAIEDDPDIDISSFGNPCELASNVIGEYRNQHWVGRHPILAHFILPPILTIVLQVLFVVAILFSIEFCSELFFGAEFLERKEKRDHSQITIFSLLAVCYWTRFVPYGITIWWAVRNHCKSGLGYLWALIPILSTTFLAAITNIELKIPSQFQEGQFTIGTQFDLTTMQIFQTAFALAIGMLLLYRAKVSRRNLVT